MTTNFTLQTHLLLSAFDRAGKNDGLSLAEIRLFMKDHGTVDANHNTPDEIDRALEKAEDNLLIRPLDNGYNITGQGREYLAYMRKHYDVPVFEAS